jgi:hypothetical protein
MKCEICHSRDAETAIAAEGREDDELYVCKECARAEKVRRQKKSQRTRRNGNLPPGVSISVSGFGDADSPPPFLEAIMNAVTNAFTGSSGDKNDKSGRKGRGSGANGSSGKDGNSGEKPSGEEKELFETSVSQVDPAFLLRGALHLEGLHLTGELGEVMDAIDKLGFRLEGLEAEGVIGVGHSYFLMNDGDERKARRVLREILVRERSARGALRDEMRRTYEDAICRSLALLKNCRYLSPGEFVDLLSPLRLAAQDSFLDGIDEQTVETLIDSAELRSGKEEEGEFRENFDEMDGSLADRTNSMFEDVVLSDRAEEFFK